MVTPCVGVWIETEIAELSAEREKVTPCVGVWIETGFIVQYNRRHIVTPCVGVWIETITVWNICRCEIMSHPAWVCGLKQRGVG